MAVKLIFLTCCLLVLLTSTTKGKPFLDEELETVEDIANIEKQDDINGLNKNNDGNDDDEVDDIELEEADENDGGEEDEDEEDEDEEEDDPKNSEEVEKRVEDSKGNIVTVRDNSNKDEEDDGEEDDSKKLETVDRRFEDADGGIVTVKKDDDDDTNVRRAGDDLDEEDGNGEPNLQSMGKQITKLQKLFNYEIPKQIESLKIESKQLTDDLDELNQKVARFLRENTREPAEARNMDNNVSL